ncbi:MAG TPA: hypothetical protein VHD15_05870 [Hyphomicrobiales bacterium]|nr:hypothetical protein [Hyphomicrobiales bacterium]
MRILAVMLAAMGASLLFAALGRAQSRFYDAPAAALAGPPGTLIRSIPRGGAPDNAAA